MAGRRTPSRLKRYPRYVDEHRARQQELAQLSDQTPHHPTRWQRRRVAAFVDELRDLTPNW